MNKKILDVLEYFKANPHLDTTDKIFSKIKKFIKKEHQYKEKYAHDIFMNNIYGTREYAESFLLIS